MIEIQLRDPQEHEWALAVERTGARLGIGLKEGEGPDDLKEYFRLASLGMYMERMGEEADPSGIRRRARARATVLQEAIGMPLVHFLLVYDRKLQKLVFEHAYKDPAEALQAYEEMEEKHRDKRHMEIVLVGADSIETVQLTHGNYWAADPDAEPAASPYLAGV
jgi:hypothetical protein